MHAVLRMDDCSPVCSLEYETLENYIVYLEIYFCKLTIQVVICLVKSYETDTMANGER